MGPSDAARMGSFFVLHFIDGLCDGGRTFLQLLFAHLCNLLANDAI